VDKIEVVWASGSRGKEVRADGTGKPLNRGYWYKRPGFALGVSLAGPFKTKLLALESLVRDLQECRR
jgi:hypothetical protein